MEEDMMEDEDITEKTVVRLSFVQPKSLQECSIIYDDAAISPVIHTTPAEEPEDDLKVSLSPSRMANLALVAQSPPRQQSSPVGHSSSRYPDPPTLPPPSMTNHNKLAEAASKISLLSPDQFQIPLPTRPYLVMDDSASPPPSQAESSPAPHKVELVQTVSGNSSPSRGVADILGEVGQYENQEQEEEEDSPTADRTFQDTDFTPSPNSVEMSQPALFPTPPAIPQQGTAITTEMDNMGLAMMRQIKQERCEQTVDLANIEKMLESSMMKRLDMMEQRLEEVARQGKKEQTDMLVLAQTNGINKKMEQVIGQGMNIMLPSLVNRSMEGLERAMMSKMAGIESKMSKELSTSQSRDAIGRAVAGGVRKMVDNSYRQAFALQAAGLERALGSMLKQISEQFLAGSREYEAALSRRIEVKNMGVKDMGVKDMGVKDMVAPLVSTMQGLNGEFRQMKDTIDRVKVEQGALNRQVGDIRAGVTGQEVRDLVKKEVVDALDGRNITLQPDVKNITVQQNIQDSYACARAEAELACELKVQERTSIGKESSDTVRDLHMLCQQHERDAGLGEEQTESKDVIKIVSVLGIFPMSILFAEADQLRVQKYTKRECPRLKAVGSQLKTMKHSVKVNIF